MVFKATPKGYLQQEHPLPHNMLNYFSLSVDDTLATNATYIPLILNDEGLVNADTVNVNPEHASFAESNNPYCYKKSIIPKINFTMQARLTKGAVETDKLRNLEFYWMPVYVSFLNRLEAEDSKTAVQIEDILELEHETVGKSAYPIWGNVNLPSAGSIGIHANATTALMGLTTDATTENIVFDRELFFDALQYYTNAPMLKKVVGSMHRVVLSRDRNYFYHSNNFTNPMVKRINDYTFCGILVFAEKAGSARQLVDGGDVTAIAHMIFQCHTRYDEWNSDFDQTAT